MKKKTFGIRFPVFLLLGLVAAALLAGCSDAAGGAPGPAAPAESEQAEAPAAQTAGIVRGKVTDSNSNMLIAVYAAAAKNRAGRQKE